MHLSTHAMDEHQGMSNSPFAAGTESKAVSNSDFTAGTISKVAGPSSTEQHVPPGRRQPCNNSNKVPSDSVSQGECLKDCSAGLAMLKGELTKQVCKPFPITHLLSSPHISRGISILMVALAPFNSSFILPGETWSARKRREKSR